MKLITICIPTYNQSKSLKRLLNQISKYNPSNPIIISDNGSNDDTHRIVNKFKKKLKKLKYIRLRKNFGFDYNYLTCIKKVKTQYFWVIGSDDQIYINSINNISKILNYLNFPNGITFIDNKNKKNILVNFKNIKKFNIIKNSNDLGKICINIINKKKFFSKQKKIKFNFGYIHLYYIINSILKYNDWYIYENNIISKTNYFSKHLKSKSNILKRLNSEINGYLKNINPKAFKFNEYHKYKKLIFIKNIRPWIFTNLLINKKEEVMQIIEINNQMLKDIKNFQIIKKIIIFIPQDIIRIILKFKLFLFND